MEIMARGRARDSMNWRRRNSPPLAQHRAHFKRCTSSTTENDSSIACTLAEMSVARHFLYVVFRIWQLIFDGLQIVRSGRAGSINAARAL